VEDESIQQESAVSRRLVTAADVKSNESLKNVKYTWKDGTMKTDEAAVNFLSTAVMSNEIEALETPLQYLKYFFTSDVIAHITEQTMFYSTQKRPENPKKITDAEIEQFIGIALYMSLVRMASTPHATTLVPNFACHRSQIQ